MASILLSTYGLITVFVRLLSQRTFHFRRFRPIKWKLEFVLAPKRVSFAFETCALFSFFLTDLSSVKRLTNRNDEGLVFERGDFLRPCNCQITADLWVDLWSLLAYVYSSHLNSIKIL